MTRLAENYLPFIQLEKGFFSNYPISAPVFDTGGQTIDIRYTGAKCDGVTDDILAIERAIAALPTRGGTIFIPVATTMISRPIIVRQHGVYINGVGFSSLYADQPAQQPGMAALSRLEAMPGFSTANAMIQYGELGTSKMWTNGGVQGLFLRNSNASSGHGIDILNVQHTHIRDCGLDGFTRSIMVDSDQSGGISFTNVEWNLAYNQKGEGIYLGGGSQENYIRFNYLVNSSIYGIISVGTGNTIAGNHVQGVNAGAGAQTHKGTGIFNSGSQCFIIGNDTLYSDLDGIYTAGNTVTVSGNSIRNPNKSSGANGSGIYVNGSGTGLMVDGNNIVDGQGKMAYGVYDNTSTVGGAFIGPGNAVTGEQVAKYFTANGVLAPNVFLSKVGAGQVSPTAALDVAAATTAAASLRLRSGTAPSSPNDGDIWYDGTNLKIRVGGTTKTVTIT